MTQAAGTIDVPFDLTTSSSRYRRNAWLATAGLLSFAAVYIALAGWFGWTAYRLAVALAGGAGKGAATLIAAAGAAFLAIFMLKALIFVKRSERLDDIEITATEQPALFEFLNRLADETGAPRPHRVYASPRVNAGVFYDLSIANVLIPSHKNLAIGLGLVNVLSLGELKAVLAHEFGHFAQRTMAVGRWVYIARQIAGHIVARRDALDTLLSRLSSIDPRVAWIAWALRIIIWAIRSLIDLLFRVVVLAECALSREMEFQADLVSVSVSGSDALIQALHRLGAADEAWNRAVAFAADELRAGRGVQDLFAIQSRIIEKMRSVLNDAAYGAAPRVPAEAPQNFRLFKAALAAPPQMWSTHPSNRDREENAKRIYVSAPIDTRSAWTLFLQPQALRERVSAHMARNVDFKPVPIEESLGNLDAQYSREYLDRAYRGAYLGRSVVRHAQTVVELYEAGAPNPWALQELYPESLSNEIERLRALEEEKRLLEALRAGFLTAPGGVIRHRGEPIRRKALPAVIERVQLEIAAISARVRAHDQRCRSTHLEAAGRLGQDWKSYLQGLLSLHHYADHVEANLLDAQALLSNTVSVAIAGGKVSRKGVDRIVHAADTAYAVLKEIHDQASQVIADRTVLRRLECAGWREALVELQLPSPQRTNIGEWLKVAQGWFAATAASLDKLRLASLEQLLAAEKQVAHFTRSGLQPGAAPPPSSVPRNYRLLVPGTERPKQTQLDWWGRFLTASGVLPAVARFCVAAAVIVGVLWLGSALGSQH
jgi:Zn-dependent protease with chaperone function